MPSKKVKPSRNNRKAGTGDSLPKDFLTVADISRSVIVKLLSSADSLKRQRQAGTQHQYLLGGTLGLIFEKPSTRTRVSFEAGMNQLGGQALFLPVSDIQLSRGESIADTARVFSLYLDGLVVRTFDHATVEEWGRESRIPVINGLTDQHHPCQALSDLMTIQEKKGRLKGLKVAYIGDGNNVAHSLMEGTAKMGMAMTVGCPSGYEPDSRIVDRARVDAAASGGVIEIHEDPAVAVKDADVVYTDVWTSMGHEREEKRRLKVLSPYQLNARLLKKANARAIVMHCLPAHRGQEITGGVLDGKQSVILDQAENRLHMQKAILVELLRKKKTVGRAARS